MERTVSIFRNGRNQAVRLPVDFEFDVDKVYVRRNADGDIVLSKHSMQQQNWLKLLSLLPKIQLDNDFLSEKERNQDTVQRDPFDWVN